MDATSAVPLAEQIAAAVRGALADGSLQPGDRLPAAHTLADSLQINLHTVLRGYQQLRDEGLIDLRRGRGATVVGDADALRIRVRESARTFVNQARRLGMSTAQMAKLIEEVAR